MDHELNVAVRHRAGERCEYCHLPAAFFEAPAQIDHIIPKKHGGATASENLALSCFFCNSYKGPNLSGIDPVSGEIIRLFHPRRDAWAEHFLWNGAALLGRTGVGRALWSFFPFSFPDLDCSPPGEGSRASRGLDYCSCTEYSGFGLLVSQAWLW